MTEPLVLVEHPRPGVAAVTLNRPERRNALSTALMEELCAAIRRLESDPAQRVLILRGAGPAFCAGLDLKEAADPRSAEQSSEWAAMLFRTLAETPLVTIAAARGAAIAGGGGLMAACDFAVASDDLQIAFPEVRRGLVPALISTVLMRRLRDADLRELLLLAEPLDARRAREMGLVNRVVPAGRAYDEALDIADLVLRGGPDAVRHTKQLLAELHAAPPAERLDRALAFHRQARTSDEAREGIAAFLEKREPRWISTEDDSVNTPERA